MFLNVFVLNEEHYRKLLLLHLFLHAVPNWVLFLTSILRYTLPLCKHSTGLKPASLLWEKQKERLRSQKDLLLFCSEQHSPCRHGSSPTLWCVGQLLEHTGSWLLPCCWLSSFPAAKMLKCIKRSQDWNWTPRLFSFSNYHHFQGDVAHGKEEAKTLTQGKGSVQWVLAVKMRSMLFLPLSSIFPILLLFGEGGGLTSTLLQDWSSK